MKITSAQIMTSFSQNPQCKRIPKNFVRADVNYFCPRIEYVQNIIYPAFKIWLISCGLNDWTYQWDCDNFADAFKVFASAYYYQKIKEKPDGIAIGVINYLSEGGDDKPKGRHAINIIYAQLPDFDENGKEKFGMFFLEPQNGRLYTLSLAEFKSIWTVYI